VSSKVRVLLQDVPLMLREIVENALLRQPDMVLMRDARAAAHAADATVPDVVLVGTTTPQDPRTATALLNRWPRARVLMLATSGKVAVMYSLTPQLDELRFERLGTLHRVMSRTVGARSISIGASFEVPIEMIHELLKGNRLVADIGAALPDGLLVLGRQRDPGEQAVSFSWRNIRLCLDQLASRNSWGRP
jgi:hypothetical protein